MQGFYVWKIGGEEAIVLVVSLHNCTNWLHKGCPQFLWITLWVACEAVVSMPILKGLWLHWLFYKHFDSYKTSLVLILWVMNLVRLRLVSLD